MATLIRPLHPRLLTTGRPKLSYIPWKTKEEIIGLHAEDATRWNASTLSTRFGAPRENVDAILRLAAIRKDRERMLQTLAKDKREGVIKAREKALGVWQRLAESVPTAGSIRSPARPSELDRPAGEIRTEVKGEAGASDDQSDKDGVVPEDLEDEEEVEIVGNSSWADYVESEVGKFEPDVERQTTYAFVEVGDEKEKLRRAVWIREGSGNMRLANEAERRLLLNEDRARDSSAWE